ncbi:PAS domain-containing methyl-accepting chemotaxis protein [Oleiagrimonas sp. C23AA]|uniref:methyl-accepting chemotaxis protein n=1 Tax=Oleiagrimonas sp. C23AA TaxID=2719047 RepID=UPI001421B95F|nr:PAS domain-containing methyl-accepting chemotaxis protein [Oleiagrimonas sp. C23AA]NII09504.1 PAS domain S-box protein [Oleiagrimonas sp. C23AA]
MLSAVEFFRSIASKLGSAEHRYREALVRGQAVIDFHADGTIRRVNDDFLQLFGYARHEVIGHHHRMFVGHHAETDEYRAFWADLAHGQFKQGVYKRYTKAGREVWIQGTYSPLFDRRGRVVGVVKHAVDVTDNLLRQADMRGRLAAIDRSQAVITFDLNGIILDANENFLRATGYALEEIVGAHHRIFVPGSEHQSQAYADFWAHLRKGEYREALFKRLRKDGSELWIQATYNPILDAAGRPVKVVKYATDVTARTRASMCMSKALGDLSAAIPSIAEQSMEAASLASSASERAKMGSHTVAELDKAISAINQHAKDMNEMVSTINGISFQTNLLALNATVEAAHAGALGQGFAVVAKEVRELATRSGQSATQIRQVIEHVADALTQCTGHAAQARQAMEDILLSSVNVSDHIRRIAASTQRQSADVAEIDRAVGTMRSP